jgi:hypothetical protein
MARVATNIPQDPLRWSVIRAAEEFKIDQVTLRKRLVAAEQELGEDGCYSTEQIVGAIFDSSKALKDRTEKERGEYLALKNQAMRGELLNRTDIENGLKALHQACAQIIKGSSLSKKDQNDILANLAEQPSVLENVARKQKSRFKEDSEE